MLSVQARKRKKRGKNTIEGHLNTSSTKGIIRHLTLQGISNPKTIWRGSLRENHIRVLSNQNLASDHGWCIELSEKQGSSSGSAPRVWDQAQSLPAQNILIYVKSDTKLQLLASRSSRRKEAIAQNHNVRVVYVCLSEACCCQAHSPEPLIHFLDRVEGQQLQYCRNWDLRTSV